MDGDKEDAEPSTSFKKEVSQNTVDNILNENKALIASILENQNVGRLEECTHQIDRVQQNLMFLASIVDNKGESHPNS